jgi:serine protease Do
MKTHKKLSVIALAVSIFFLPLYRVSAQEAANSTSSSDTGLKVDQQQISRSSGAVSSFAPVIEKVAPSVVTIFSTKTVKRDPRLNPLLNDPQFRRFFGIPDPDTDGGGNGRKIQGLGSGIIVSKEGHILTNNHVIDGADEVMVSIGMEKHEYPAEKIGTDPATDLAVLKIKPDTDITPVVFADSSRVKAGDIVFAIGNPFGLTQSASMGIVSAVGRGGMGIADYENFIQTDAAINMGNSGGALVDTEGRLIGVNTAIFSRSGGNQGIGFAVPSNLARTVMKSIVEKGRVVRGFIGVLVQPLSQELAEAFKIKNEEGALVAEVSPEGPADRAGVRNGDVITRLNDEVISDPQDLQLTVAAIAPETTVTLTIVRDGKEKKIDVRLGELPSKGVQVAQTESVGKSNVLDGITIGDIDPAARRQFNLPEGISGVVVIQIDPQSVGAEAGLRVGDVIQEMNRKELTDAAQAINLSNEIEKDETVLLRVVTKGQSRFVVLKPKHEEG